MMDKETIKQFLKPDWRKIVILGILFLFLFPLSIVCPGSNTRLSKVGGTCAFENIIGMEYYEFPDRYYYSGFILALWENLIVLILISITIFYLLSCLMVFVYDKLKTKK